MRVSDTPIFTGIAMPDGGWVLVSLPINATEFRVHRIAKTSLGQTGPTGPAGPAGPAGLPGSSTFPNQIANTVFSGPVAGVAAAPAFRALVAADMPDLSATYLPLTGGTLTGSLQAAGAVVASQYTTQDMGTLAQWTWYADAGMFKLTNTVAVDVLTVSEAGALSVLGAGLFGGAVTLPGAPTLPLHAATKAYVDAAVVGVVGDQTANTVFAGPTGGAAAAPAFRALVAADIPSLSGSYLPLSGGTLTGPLVGTTIQATTSIQVSHAESDTIAAGPFYQLTNPGGSFSQILQLNTAGGLSFWNYDLSLLGWTSLVSISKIGLLQGTDATFLGVVTAQRTILGVSAVTYAATTDLDFNLAAFRTLALTGNVTFTTSNRAAGKTASVKILCDATPRTFTFPAWKWMGTAPTGIAANKTARLSIEAWGANDTDVVAAYAVEA